jgi:hypothetical protein
MSTPTFAGKVEIAPTATCNSCRGPLPDEHFITDSLTDRLEIFLWVAELIVVPN